MEFSDAITNSTTVWISFHFIFFQCNHSSPKMRVEIFTFYLKFLSFQTLVILLHSLKVLTSKVHSKDVKKANYFRVFCKILSKLCWGHVPCGDVIFFKS
jgi:hypothetical protein